MAIDKTYLLGKNITLGCGFDLQAKAPLDSRQVVPEYDGLLALITGDAAYEGMIVYDEGTKKTYQAQTCDPYAVTIGEGDDAVEKTYSLAFREFGINEEELRALIASETTAAMEFKGAATALPENPSKGDFYKVTTSFDVVEGETAKVGDSIVYDGEQWFIIPSGDDIEDTWRPVTDVDNDATLTFVAGDKLEKTVAADGTITYKHAAVDAPEDVTEDGDEKTRTYITEVVTDGFGHITGYKTATENVEDTNTTYEFEGLPVGEDEEAPSSVYFQVKSSEEEAAEVVYLDAYSKNEADDKFQPVGDYKTIQAAIEAVATEANVFVDTVAQDANGVITITTKAVDFTAADDRFKKLQTAIAAVSTAKNVFIDTIAQDAQGVITITTKAVDFSDYRTAADQDTIDATFKTKQEAYSAEGSTVKTVTKVTQDANGEVEVTYEDIAFPEYVDTNTVTTVVKGAGIEVSATGEGTEAVTYTVAHADTSDVTSVVAADRTYVKSLTFDDFGHVTDVETGTETVVDTNTTYTVAATEEPLQFTVTPSEGEAQTITLVAPTVDTGVMKVTAGTDIVVTPESGTGEITVSHATYQTGIVKDATHDSETDPSFITGISVENGHVTGATVKNLAEVLASMDFILDGGEAE